MGIDNESLRILRRIRAVTAPWRVLETLSLSLHRRFYLGILARDFSNPRWTKREARRGKRIARRNVIVKWRSKKSAEGRGKNCRQPFLRPFHLLKQPASRDWAGLSGRLNGWKGVISDEGWSWSGRARWIPVPFRWTNIFSRRSLRFVTRITVNF